MREKFAHTANVPTFFNGILLDAYEVQKRGAKAAAESDFWISFLEANAGRMETYGLNSKISRMKIGPEEKCALCNDCNPLQILEQLTKQRSVVLQSLQTLHPFFVGWLLDVDWESRLKGN